MNEKARKIIFLLACNAFRFKKMKLKLSLFFNGKHVGELATKLRYNQFPLYYFYFGVICYEC